MIEQFFDTMIVASSDSGYNDPSNYKCWKRFWATLIFNLNETDGSNVMSDLCLIKIQVNPP